MSPIIGLSEKRRLPRLGKIHLGIKVKDISKKTGKEIEYPSEVSYFVVPEKVKEIYGEKPTELKVMFPVENPEVFFQQWYKLYGSSSLLKCKGDGKIAITWDEEKGGLKEIPCPCEKLEAGDCKQIGTLQFLLPDVAGAGVWQVTTSSKNSIIDLNSSVDYIKGLCGRIRMIPLVLKRVPIETQRIEGGLPKKTKHYTLQLDLENISLRQLQEAAQIEPEKVLLPVPDESKDELLYPANGFKPEEEPKEEIKEEEKQPVYNEEGYSNEEKPKEKFKLESDPNDIETAKGILSGLLGEFMKLGGIVKGETVKKISNFKTIAEYSKAIDYYQAQIDEKKRTKHV